MSEVMLEDEQFRAKLDELGEDKVRARLVLDVYDARKRLIVVDWLAQQAEKRQADAQDWWETREDEALALARRANWISCFAAVIAVVAIIVGMVK